MRQPGLPYDSGPLPEPRCWVCGGWVNRPQPPPDKRITYAVLRQQWLKIGMTGNLRERFGVLSRSTPGCVTLHPPEMAWAAPLSLVAVVEGDIEHELHERFAHAHALGEWFDFTDPAVRDWAWRARRATREGTLVLPSEESRLLLTLEAEEREDAGRLLR